jgi:hypothetical protein
MATSDDGGDGACFVAPSMLEFKLLEQSGDTTTGTFSGYLAAYGNTDENEDRLMPGAFTASLAEYRRAGEMPPCRHGSPGRSGSLTTTLRRGLRRSPRRTRMAGAVTIPSLKNDATMDIPITGLALDGITVGELPAGTVPEMAAVAAVTAPALLGRKSA